tara:strand:+ start:581 stop:790 length:210 start_codon:yes stop_codon:yes gene_type:complete
MMVAVMKKFTLRIPAELQRRLSKRARGQNCSVNTLILQYIDRCLDGKKPFEMAVRKKKTGSSEAVVDAL